MTISYVPFGDECGNLIGMGRRRPIVSLLFFLLPYNAALGSTTFFTRSLSSLPTIGDLPDPRGSQFLNRKLAPAWPLPATTVMTPTAFGAEWKDIFIGVGAEDRARYGSLPHATMHLGFGLGDAETLGLETTFSSYGLFRRGPPFSTGGVSFKLHRFFPEWNLSAAVGYDNAIVWSVPDSGQSFFAVVSKYVPLKEKLSAPFSLFTIHLGLGDGRYRSESEVRARRETPTFFGAASLLVIERVSFIANWTGSDLALGASLTPFQKLPLVATFSAIDLTGAAGDGARMVFLLSYAFTYNKSTVTAGDTGKSPGQAK